MKMKIINQLVGFAILSLLILTQAHASDGLLDEGVKKYRAGDFKGAGEAWIQCAKLDQADCQALIGKLYMDGSGIRKNPEKAIIWLTKSAEQGYAPGQYLLAQLYIKSETYNPYKAYMWSSLAYEQGISDAYKIFSGLILTEGEKVVTKGDQMIKEFRNE